MNTDMPLPHTLIKFLFEREVDLKFWTLTKTNGETLGPLENSELYNRQLRKVVPLRFM